MQKANVHKAKAAGAGHTNGFLKENFQSHSNTGGVGRKPSHLRVVIPCRQMDFLCYPLWRRLSRVQGNSLFKLLGGLIGKSRLFTELGASYIRFLTGQEA